MNLIVIEMMSSDQIKTKRNGRWITIKVRDVRRDDDGIPGYDPDHIAFRFGQRMAEDLNESIIKALL